MHFKKTLLTSLLTLSLLVISVMPFSVNAQSLSQSTTSQLQAQIRILLLKVQELRRKIHADSSVSTYDSLSETTSVTTDGDSKNCLNLYTNLKQGSRDIYTHGAVSELQDFLTKTGDYTYGRVTGYYGPSTERAVQRWQVRNNVVSSGLPDTTGYGAVGPLTRKILAKLCNNNPDKTYLKANDPTGTAPHTVTFTTDIISGYTSDEKIYLNFGDGDKQELTLNFSSCGTSCLGFGGYSGPPLKVAHTYSNSGKYTAYISSELSNYFDGVEKVDISVQ